MSYWKPTKGSPATIQGRLLEVGHIDTGARALHLETKEGTVWTVVLEAPSLQRGLQDAHPRLGTGMGIRFEGEATTKGGRSYLRFTVVAVEPMNGSGDFDTWFKAVRRDMEHQPRRR